MKNDRGTDLLLLLPPVKIFALIWLIQLFAAAGASGDDDNICAQENVLTIILEINKEEANCAVLNCLSGKINSIDLYKCDSSGQCDKIPTNSTNEAIDPSVINKLKSDKSVNCSSSINLNTFSPEANKNNSVYRPISTVNTTATALNQKPALMIPPLTEGQPATLTCTAAALCSGARPNFTWWLTAAGQKDIIIRENITELMVNNMTQNHTTALSITASAEHHNKNITCRVAVAGNIIEETKTLKVNYNRKILKTSSKCEVESEVVTCVCVSEGFPLPTISWPLLKNSPKHTIITNVSDHSVTSTMTVSLKDPDSTTILCVSNYNGNKTKENITIHRIPTNKSQSRSHPMVLQLLEEILRRPLLFLVLGTGVLIGMLLSAVIACLAVKCHRKKKSKNLDEGLEMVTMETVSKKEEDGIQDQEAAAGGGDESAGQLATDSNEAPQETVYANINEADAAPKETVYSDIDFSAMKAKNPADVNKEDIPETEYAEIKKGEFDERPDDGGGGEKMEGDDEKVVMLGEAERSLLAEEALVEDLPLCSTMDEAMKEN